MNRFCRPTRLVAVIALLPALALAQQPDSGGLRPAPPLPERVRALDESLQQEIDDLVRQATPLVRDQGRLAAALKAQQAAWLQYRDASCALVGLPDGATSNRALQCKAEWAEAQRLRLWPVLDCVGQVAQVLPAERDAELERCLQAFMSSLRP
jgi:uncharacterized protein YecT (DUF1311 family)